MADTPPKTEEIVDPSNATQPPNYTAEVCLCSPDKQSTQFPSSSKTMQVKTEPENEPSGHIPTSLTEVKNETSLPSFQSTFGTDSSANATPQPPPSNISTSAPTNGLPSMNIGMLATNSLHGGSAPPSFSSAVPSFSPHGAPVMPSAQGVGIPSNSQFTSSPAAPSSFSISNLTSPSSSAATFTSHPSQLPTSTQQPSIAAPMQQSRPPMGGLSVPAFGAFQPNQAPSLQPQSMLGTTFQQTPQFSYTTPQHQAMRQPMTTAAIVKPTPEQLLLWAEKSGLRARLPPDLSEADLITLLDKLYQQSLAVHANKQRQIQQQQQMQQARMAAMATVAPPRPPPAAPKTVKIPLTKEEEKEAMEDILAKLKRHRFGWPFLEPVDHVGMELTDYPDIIKNPMDFGTMQTKLDNGDYTETSQFAADIKLTLDNCKLYNPEGTDYHQMAVVLEQFFDKEKHKLEAKTMYELPNGKLVAKPPSAPKREESVDDDSDSDEDGEYRPGGGGESMERRNSNRLKTKTPRSFVAEDSSDEEDASSASSSDDEQHRVKRRKGPLPSAATDIPFIPTEVSEWRVERILDYRRADGGDKTFVRDDDVEYEYYIKWKGVSYLHLEWVEEGVITQEGHHGKTKINRFWRSLQETPIEEKDELFPEEYTEVERIIDKKNLARPGEAALWKYLVKWYELPYTECTWELAEDINNQAEIDDYERRSLVKQLQARPRPLPEAWKQLPENPTFKDGNQLRPYQVEGLNWLIFCWYNRRGCILADEMGLGKTVQSMAFFDHLHRREGIPGPFLVVAPLSTIGHWQRELRTWSDMNVVTYTGNKANRELIRTYEWFYRNLQGDMVQSTTHLKFNVLVTTYEMVLNSNDWEELSRIEWRCCVIDEAQRLKNKRGKLLEHMKTFNIEHRVLLTGTPLQNNTTELWTLLNFIEPRKFWSHAEFNNQFGELESSEQVGQLHALLKPHLLRRMKEDVEKSIPPKEETVVEVELTSLQKAYYRAILERNRDFLDRGVKGNNTPNLLNVVMQLRKVCNHPFLIQGVEDRETENLTEDTDYFHKFVYASGKMALLDKLLPKLKEDGHKVLIFSQMVRVLDLLETYLQHKGYLWERIDGGVRGIDRQRAIDRYNDDKQDRFVFLLCTRAGGVGINLASADTVVIFDSDWNPQNDVQAQARAHRIGQKREVKVYRLITKKTYESVMFQRINQKLGLDQAVLNNMGHDHGKFLEKQDEGGLSALNKKEIDSLLKHGAYDLFREEEGDADAFYEDDIESIMQRNAKTIRYDGDGQEKNSSFSKAVFKANNDEELDMDAEDFWERVLPERKTAKRLLERFKVTQPD